MVFYQWYIVQRVKSVLELFEKKKKRKEFMLRIRKSDEHVTDVWPYTRRGKNCYCRQTLDSVNFNNAIRLVVSLIIHL